MDVEISTLHLVRDSSIFVELGIPSVPGEFHLSISIARQSSLDEVRNFFIFEEIGEFPIPGDKPISEVYKRVSEILLIKNITIPHFRLRERIGERLARIYREKTLKEQGMIDKK